MGDYPTKAVKQLPNTLCLYLGLPRSLSLSTLTHTHTHTPSPHSNPAPNSGQGLLYGNFQATVEGRLLAGAKKARRAARGVCVCVLSVMPGESGEERTESATHAGYTGMIRRARDQHRLNRRH